VRRTPRAMTPCRRGRMVVMALSSPATAMRSWPERATGVEPKTGAAM
jgi:hypothetical protein